MRTRVCELLGIDIPVVGFTPSPEVAAALSRAGGFGVLGAVRYASAGEFDRALDYMDAHSGGRPYGVDVVMPSKAMAEGSPGDLEAHIGEAHRRFVDGVLARYGVPELPPGAHAEGITAWMHAVAREQVDVALRHPVKLVANALGAPPPDVVRRAHDAGVLVAALAGRAEHAARHCEAGVDVLVAQGHEAGGHTGEVTTMVLVPEVVKAARGRPVLAAGGIGTGAQVAAALALGADGVWMGSVWLTCAEYRLDPAGPSGRSVITDKLLRATSSDTVRSRVVSGKPARMLKTDWTRAWEAEGAPDPLPMPLQGLLVADAEARIRAHQAGPLLGVPVGQIVGQMNEVEPVAAIVARLLREYEASVARLRALG